MKVSNVSTNRRHRHRFLVRLTSRRGWPGSVTRIVACHLHTGSIERYVERLRHCHVGLHSKKHRSWDRALRYARYAREHGGFLRLDSNLLSALSDEWLKRVQSYSLRRGCRTRYEHDLSGWRGLRHRTLLIGLCRVLSANSFASTINSGPLNVVDDTMSRLGRVVFPYKQKN